MPTITVAQHIDFIDFFLRLSCAVFCGFLIGFERQWINRVAGIQTNVLVCTGASVFVLGSYFVSYEGQAASRISAQIVSGIGFLGAGMIFRDGMTTHGINTAATMWCAGAVGVLCAMGLIPHAFVVVMFLIGANLIFRRIDNSVMNSRKWSNTRVYNAYEFQVLTPNENLKELKRKMLVIFHIDDCHVYSVKTTPMKQNLVKISVCIKTKALTYQDVHNLSEKLDDLGESAIVDWSQIK